jgi:enoyl-CoA hydratase
MRVYSRLVTTLRSLRQPVIAAVNGPAYGGGMCLAMGCDMRFASSSATFNATGIVNGLTSTEMAAAWLLPRQIGATNANDLLLTGRVVEAAEALRLGLVSRVAPDDVVALAVETAAGMASFSPYGLAMTKDVLWANLEIGSMAAAIELEDRNQLMLGFTENLPEAIRAFDAGRPPVYTDEPRKDIYSG